jgi:hypothetical protein
LVNGDILWDVMPRYACNLLLLLSDTEDGENPVIRNVGKFPPEYKARHSRRQYDGQISITCLPYAIP